MQATSAAMAARAVARCMWVLSRKESASEGNALRLHANAKPPELTRHGRWAAHAVPVMSLGLSVGYPSSSMAANGPARESPSEGISHVPPS